MTQPVGLLSARSVFSWSLTLAYEQSVEFGIHDVILVNKLLQQGEELSDLRTENSSWLGLLCRVES